MITSVITRDLTKRFALFPCTLHLARIILIAMTPGTAMSASPAPDVLEDTGEPVITLFFQARQFIDKDNQENYARLQSLLQQPWSTATTAPAKPAPLPSQPKPATTKPLPDEELTGSDAKIAATLQAVESETVDFLSSSLPATTTTDSIILPRDELRHCWKYGEGTFRAAEFCHILGVNQFELAKYAGFPLAICGFVSIYHCHVLLEYAKTPKNFKLLKHLTDMSAAATFMRNEIRTANIHDYPTEQTMTATIGRVFPGDVSNDTLSSAHVSFVPNVLVLSNYQRVRNLFTKHEQHDAVDMMIRIARQRAQNSLHVLVVGTGDRIGSESGGSERGHYYVIACLPNHQYVIIDSLGEVATYELEADHLHRVQYIANCMQEFTEIPFLGRRLRLNRFEREAPYVKALVPSDDVAY